jgi:hypothetical protein
MIGLGRSPSAFGLRCFLAAITLEIKKNLDIIL